METSLKALILSADGFEDTELLVPYYRLLEDGVEVDVASHKKGRIRGKRGYEVEAAKSFGELRAEDYDLLVLPGGKAPESVRKDEGALQAVRQFFKSRKPVSAICHGPQVLISAGLIKGKKATCYRSVAGELVKAGATYEDREVVVDGNLITSRQPADLPAFMRETMRALGKVGAKR